MMAASQPDFVFEPPLRGSWKIGDQAALDLANEEAAHAVMCALLGIEILEVRIDSPIQEDDVPGLVATVPNMDRLYDHLLAVLAGPLMAGREVPWPPNIAAGGDEGICARLVAKLGLDEERFNEAKNIARGLLLDSPSSRRAYRAVGRALLERGALTGAEVAALVAEAAAGL
jgi:hypothetical protein